LKNLDVTVSQIVLLIVGSFYIYQAVGLFNYNRTNFGTQSSFVFTVFIGVMLLGLALALQQIRSYRKNKAEAVKVAF